MYKNEFHQKISQNHIFDSVFFYGLSTYMMEYYTHKMINLIDDKSPIKTVYFDDYDFLECKSFLSQNSLFDDNNILVIKITNKIDAKELKTLIEITTKVSNSFFILQLYPIDDEIKYSKISSSAQNQFIKFKNKSTFVRFFLPNKKECLDLLIEYSKQANTKIENKILLELLNINDDSLEMCIADINKLQIYDEEISLKEIADIHSDIHKGNIDDIIIKVLEKKDFIKEYEGLLFVGFNEIEFISKFNNFLHSLVLFNIYIKENATFDSKEILGYKLPKQIEEQRARLSIRFNIKKYQQLLEFLMDIEMSLKSTATIDKKAFLLSKLLMIQMMI